MSYSLTPDNCGTVETDLVMYLRNGGNMTFSDVGSSMMPFT
jgi:hypothetical protein